MPRNTKHNPTERIGRILEDVSALEAYVGHLLYLIPKGGTQYGDVQPYPKLEAIEEERTFRKFNLDRIMATRKNMRRHRETPVAILSPRTKEALRKLLDETQ